VASIASLAEGIIIDSRRRDWVQRSAEQTEHWVRRSNAAGILNRTKECASQTSTSRWSRCVLCRVGLFHSWWCYRSLKITVWPGACHRGPQQAV